MEAFSSRNTTKSYVAVVHGFVDVSKLPTAEHQFTEHRIVRNLKRPKPTITPELFTEIRQQVGTKQDDALSKQEKEFLQHDSLEAAQQVKRMRKFMYNFVNDHLSESVGTAVADGDTEGDVVAAPLHTEPSVYRPPGSDNEFYITANIAQVPDDFRMEIGTASNPGRCSCTHAQVLMHGTYQGKPVTKVLLHPITGRRHQLRVHMKHAGFPIGKWRPRLILCGGAMGTKMLMLCLRAGLHCALVCDDSGRRDLRERPR